MYTSYTVYSVHCTVYTVYTTLFKGNVYHFVHNIKFFMIICCRTVGEERWKNLNYFLFSLWSLIVFIKPTQSLILVKREVSRVGFITEGGNGGGEERDGGG